MLAAYQDLASRYELDLISPPAVGQTRSLLTEIELELALVSNNNWHAWLQKSQGPEVTLTQAFNRRLRGAIQSHGAPLVRFRKIVGEFLPYEAKRIWQPVLTSLAAAEFAFREVWRGQQIELHDPPVGGLKNPSHEHEKYSAPPVRFDPKRREVEAWCDRYHLRARPIIIDFDRLGFDGLAPEDHLTTSLIVVQIE